VYWRGATNAQGRVDAELQVPTGVQELEVVLIKGGFEGPWTELETRKQLGTFAPAAWIRARPDELARIAIALDARRAAGT
jgi:hypothetical protein